MRSFTISTLAALMATTMFTSVGNTQEINFGPFSGTLTTTVSQGFQMRTEENDCKLVAGSATSYSSAIAGLIGGSANDGNGGCDAKMTSSLGTSSKVVGIGSSNSDDGRVNFKKGDFTDASTSLSFSYAAQTQKGIGFNLSGSGLQNHVLDLNTPTFKQFTNEAKDHLETNIKLGNAYVTVPLGDVDASVKSPFLKLTLPSSELALPIPTTFEDVPREEVILASHPPLPSLADPPISPAIAEEYEVAEPATNLQSFSSVLI
jgi:hypothetical protein